MAESIQIISLGGSIVAPDGVDVGYLKRFRAVVGSFLRGEHTRRLILVVGGGGPARAYQESYRSIVDAAEDESQDWIGIAATRLNAELVRALLSDFCDGPVVIDPTRSKVPGRVIVAAGWKPGFSTDNVAVMLGERYGAKRIINLSNIPKVYTADPKVDPAARPLDTLSWTAFRKIVGATWVPGKNTPFDPIASKRADELAMEVVVAAGRDVDNLQAILEGRTFVGTTIGPN
ncbi:MAG TPA: UMP kinase [Spirochaetia bacterium]|nr:UMP kinase [Spirochaetia bacterium]